jgi:glycosyltransferase involved in cell wall biosynthesis
VVLLTSLAFRVPRRIAWVHTLSTQVGLDAADRWRQRLLRLRKAAVYRAATGLVVNSRATADDVVATTRVHRDRIQVWPYLLDDPAAGGAPGGADAPGPDGPRRIVNVGRLERSKGQDVLLEAFAHVAPEHPDVVLDLIGSGPMRDELEQRAAALGLADRCVFHGSVDHDAALRAMGAAAVVVVASREEAFGLVVIEGMAMGRPVIGARTGGIADIITDGHDGVLVPPGDVDAMADALHRVLGDAEGAAALARQARATFESTYSMARIGALVDALEGGPRG